MTGEADWANRLRMGDQSALQELFNAYYPQLVAFASRLLSENDVAEDVVQDVFLSIWRNRERTQFSKENISPYLFGAVRKGATSRLRHAQVEKRWETRVLRGESDTSITRPAAADEQARFNEIVSAARLVVDELPPRCRQAFLLRRQHGLSYAEIAQVMSIAPKTVEVQIGAALRTLRIRLARFYD